MDRPEQIAPNEKPENLMVVGVGASAGGIQALRELFQNLPLDSGLAFVVILHLSPDHDSELAAILQQVASVPVTKVTKKLKLEPDHIYVISPNHHLVMADGIIDTTPNQKIEERRAPVDIFFRSLADSHGQDAISVVLSGTGANGSMGIKRIIEKGGIAIAQDPDEAEFNEMPRHSIATGLVDEILPLKQIISKIINYKKGRQIVPGAVHPEEQEKALHKILAELLSKTGNNFTNYRRPTLLRRIDRRMTLLNQAGLTDYAGYIKRHREESFALQKDILISVTNFFRDKKAFATIDKKIIPLILSKKDSREQVRIWVAGCATGEEVYSLAMLFAEHTFGPVDGPVVQIFATDIDESAIKVAREGYYTLNDVADVPLERLHRFFVKEKDGFRIRREIREMVVFAAHNFLKNPPFAKLDMVSCRNALIYLNSAAQEQAMETFHFAINPDGFLFLGSSESVDSSGGFFSVFSREERIFKRLPLSQKGYSVPELVPIRKMDQTVVPAADERRKNYGPSIQATFGDIHQQLVEEYAAPSLVINEDLDIMHMSSKVGSFLQISGGEPSKNLMDLVLPELRLELRSALYRAAQRNEPVDVRGLQVDHQGNPKDIDIIIRPFTNGTGGMNKYLLVLFEESNGSKKRLSAQEPGDGQAAGLLEEELVRVKEQLSDSIRYHDVQAKELKSSNEELQARNEELRYTTEELETNKEELGSINEELRTVNQELKVKIDEIHITSSNLQNVINSADVGTIFLDRDFRVRMFTPAVRDIFNLIPSDNGRPITDINNKLGYQGLMDDVATVLENLTPLDREVSASNGRDYMVRILPYRTNDDLVNGVVLTFFDITNRKNTEKALGRSEERLRMVIESARDYAIFTLDRERRIVSWSVGAAAIIGYTEPEIIGKLDDITYTPEDRAAGIPHSVIAKAEKEGHAEHERWHLRKDGSRFWGSGSVSPLRDGDGSLVGFVSIMRDLTETRRMQENQRLTEERQSFLLTLSDTLREFNGSPEALPDVACKVVGEFLHAGRVIFAECDKNNGEFLCTGQYLDGMPKVGKNYPLAEQAPMLLAQYKTARVAFCPDVHLEKKLTDAQKATNKALGIGSWLAASLVKENEVCALLMVHFKAPRNWTPMEIGLVEESAERISFAIERTKSETALRESHGQMVHVLESLNDAYYSVDADFNLTYVNRMAEKYWQRDRKHLLGKNIWSVFPKAKGSEAADMHEVAILEKRAVHIETLSPVLNNWVEISIYPDNVGGLSVYFRDITERKKSEEELKRLVKERTIELERSNDDLRQFAHVASHDLREPIRKISVFNTKIIEDFSEVIPEKARSYLGKIQNAAERMQAMIEGVLNYSRSGITQQEFETVALDETIRDVENDLEVLMGKKDAVIMNVGLPTVRANKTLMYQLFYNLILNALKFSKTGEPSRIEITSEPVDMDGKQFMKITLADNGIGFEEEFEKRIFEMFAKLHPTSEYEGTGLGLALCKKIVERHGGIISAKGKKNEGAIFTIHLPKEFAH